MENITRIWNQLLGSVPDVIAALIILALAFLTGWIVKTIISKLLKFLRFDDLLKKAGIADERTTKIKTFIEKFVYLIIFLLWMPGFFEKLGLNGVASPIIGMMNNILTFLPNIIGSVLLLIVGIFIGKTVRELLIPVFGKLKIDENLKKIGIQPKGEATVAVVLANVIYVVILIPIVIGALNVLQIDAISRPSIEMLNTIMEYIPKVALAIIVLFVGTFIAKLAFTLLEKALESVGLDRISDKVFEESGTKVNKEISLSKIVAYLVKYVIIAFFVVQALNVIKLDVLTNIGNMIIGYMPSAISAIIMMGLAILLANFIQKSVLKNFPESKVTALILKMSIIVMGVFVTLYQLGVATTLVNSTFIIILGAIAVAFAISFGIGGREFAAHMLNKVENKIESREKNNNK